MEEQRRVKKYVNEMRRIQKQAPKPHDCGATKRTNFFKKEPFSNRTMLEMELRAIEKPIPTRAQGVDAR